MNGYNRRRKYRRSAYRRRNIGTVLITVAVSVVAFLIILLIVGNILHKKSKICKSLLIFLQIFF